MGELTAHDVFGRINAVWNYTYGEDLPTLEDGHATEEGSEKDSTEPLKMFKKVGLSVARRAKFLTLATDAGEDAHRTFYNMGAVSSEAYRKWELEQQSD